MTIAGRCRCGATRPADDEGGSPNWITVSYWPASGQPSPSAWSLCSWDCVLELAREKTLDSMEAGAS